MRTPLVSTQSQTVTFELESPSRWIHFIILAALLALVPIAGPAQAPESSDDRPRLENPSLALVFDPRDGSLAAVTNRLTGERHDVAAQAFLLYTDQGEISPATAPLAATASIENGIRFTYRHPSAAIELDYRLHPEHHFVEKIIRLKNESDQPILIQEIIAERFRFTPAFAEVYAHDDGTDWRCPINVFLRTRKGGLFTGVENPYFEMIVPGAWQATRLDLRFAPRWILHPGETFEAEPSFLGAYRNEGIYFFKELQPFAYMSNQQIIMDWGEVWAMQEFLRDIMPPKELPYPDYYMRANAVNYFTNLGRARGTEEKPFGKDREWWPPHSHAPWEPAMTEAGKHYIDMLKKQGNIDSIDWGTIWLGHAGWLRESPDEYLERLGTDWDIEPNPHWLELIRYGQQQGFGVGIMDEGGARDYLKYEDHWKVKDKSGKPIQGVAQLEGYMGRNCWANPEFANWWVDIVSKTIDEYDVPIWGTDAGSIWWVPFDPPLECYDPDHGHPVGECAYYAWRNIMNASAELVRRHPDCVLRNAGGMHRGYPWVLRDWIEYHGYLDPVAQGEGGTVNDNIRFQGWHARNLRFIPGYKSGGGLRTDDPYGMAYGAFTHMTHSDHGEAEMVPPVGVTDPAEQQRHVDFFRKWAQWADDNVQFMRVRRDILGEPRTSKLDGSAHCIGDRGFLFVFNPGRRARAAEIPINHWIGLTEGDAFTISYIYPDDGGPVGVYQRDERLLIPVPSHEVVALSIQPADAEGSSPDARPDVSGLPVDKAFHDAADVRERFGDDIRLPPSARPADED